MSEPTLILQNMRGSCATVGNTVHTLFRFSGRPARQTTAVRHDAISAQDIAAAIAEMASSAKA